MLSKIGVAGRFPAPIRRAFPNQIRLDINAVRYMVDMSKIEDAARRLERATDAIESTIVKTKQTSEQNRLLEAQLDDLREDRSKLAQELDTANAKLARISDANSKVSGRIDAVVDNIRLLLSGV